MTSASTSDEVAAATREVLENSNLDEINERKLRQLVRQRTGADTSLPDLKALIHSVVEEFLEHDRDDDRDPDAAKASKPGKPKKRKAGEPDDSDEQDEVGDEEPVSRGGKGGSSKSAKKFPVGESGELIVCKLSGKRRVTVGEFKGTLFVSIREYYEKDGQERPGKGVSLPVEQWSMLSKHVQDVDAAIKQLQR